MNPTHSAHRLQPRLAPPAGGLSVLLAGKLTALTAPGGGETQLACLTRSLVEIGVDARLWRPWEEPLHCATVLHLVGSEPEHLPLVEAAKRSGLRVALSPVAWFDLGSLWREHWPRRKRAAACGRFLVRAAAPWLPSWRRRLYHSVDLLLPNSQAEAEQLVRYFQAPRERIRIVPNGADERFAKGSPVPFAERFGCRKFVLYAGRIEPRKNQLGFLRALHGADLDVVVLGDAAPGHERYAAECRRVAGNRTRFLGRMEHNNPLLASAYAACGCLALASWYETPGLVALEAGMSGTPLVLPAIGSAREYFGGLGEYVNPDDAQDIRCKTQAALARGRSAALARHVQDNFSWKAAAKATRDAYAEVL